MEDEKLPILEHVIMVSLSLISWGNTLDTGLTPNPTFTLAKCLAGAPSTLTFHVYLYTSNNQSLTVIEIY